MFGTKRGLQGKDSSGLGLFPRALLYAINQLNHLQQKHCLTTNLVELYMGQPCDLLNKIAQKETMKWRDPVCIDKITCKPVGFYEMTIDSERDVMNICNTLCNERRTSGHEMNDTSSRSHCLATLSLQ